MVKMVRFVKLFLFISLVQLKPSSAQVTMKPLNVLIDEQGSGWFKITTMVSHAKNKVEILEKDSAHANAALYQSQLSTNTMLGSLIYNSGGILVDEGWIRILGSGCKRLDRSVPEWNKGKLSAERNDQPFYLLVADDVLGGLFAIKSEHIDELETTGRVFYYGPNSLTWQSTGLSYSAFISFCFNGNLKEFYDGFRWKTWQEDLKNISCNQVVSCYPMLWTREGLQIKANRKLLAIQTQWNMYQGKQKSTPKQKAMAERQPPHRNNNSANESMWASTNTP